MFVAERLKAPPLAFLNGPDNAHELTAGQARNPASEAAPQQTPDQEREVDLDDLPFHDLYRLCTRMAQESPLGRLHEEHAQTGVAIIKFSLIGLFLLKMTGWSSIGWLWVLSPLWIPLLAAFLLPFGILVWALMLRRRARRLGRRAIPHHDSDHEKSTEHA